MSETPDRWQRIQEHFEELVELEGEAREARLGELRESDPELADEVEALLSGDEQASEVLGPFEAPEGEEADVQELATRLDTHLGERYTVVRELGAGGMATVFLATDEKHGRNVALKVLRPELAHDVGAERFLREIQIEARLQHVNILPLHDSGEAGGFVYYVMPYVEGESLRDRLDREKQLPVREALRITREIGGALAYAHQHGVIHRDVKPENILLSDGHAVLADFGIARAIGAAGGERVTRSGHSVGTPTYMSPEQAGGETELDGRSDIYSLGCVLYEMLAGEPPFGGRTAQSILAKHVLEPPPSIDILRPSAPSPIKTAIETALAKTPADRFQSIGELMAALPGLAEFEGTAQRVPSSVRETSRSVYGDLPSSRSTSLIREARRRYLPQVGLVYLLFGWVALDWAAELARFGAVGQWAFPAALAVLVVGLPLVLAVTWIQPSATGKAADGRRSWRGWVGRIRPGHAMSLFAVLAFAILLAKQRGGTPETVPAADEVSAESPFPPTRIAVLPFEDPNPGREFRHLATVFPEYLTRQLSRLEAFEVVPHSAVRRYSADRSVASIADAVSAGTLIEGTVIGSEDEIRVTVNLTDANELALLHSEEYRQPRGETLALLDTLSEGVARSLRRELGVVARDLERMAGTRSDEAWEYYAHGRDWVKRAERMWEAGGPDRAMRDYGRADSAFARAQAIDPDWVDPIIERGWVKYEESRIRATSLRTADPELLRQSMDFAASALAIDSLEERALLLRGTLRYWLGEMSSEAEEARRLHEEAERDLLRVTKIDPTNARAWHRLSNVFRTQGRHADAKRAAASALEADQYYEEREDVYTQLCLTSLDNRQWKELARWCEAGLREFPQSYFMLNAELLALASPGGPEPDVDRAWRVRDRFLEASPPSERSERLPSATLYVAAVLARAGLPDSARAVIRLAREATGERDAMDHYNEAHARLLLGEEEQALQLLERYLDALPAKKKALENDWWFEPLRTDPRFQALVR